MIQHIKVTEKENKGLKRSYEVVVAARAVEDQMQKELQKVGKRAKIPGFRPGKVPANVLKQKYGKSVMGDVIRNTASQASQDVITKNKLIPALSPDIQIKDYKEGSDLALSISMEIMPEVPAVDFSKISLEKPVVAVDEKEIERASGLVRERFRTLKDKEGKSAKGDVLCIAFTGYADDEPFEGGKAEHFHIELGSGQLIPGFEDQLIGKKTGDKVTVNVTFPEQYHSKALAGKPARFEVEVHEVEEIELPELNDELAKKAGAESVEDLKQKIKSQLEKDYQPVARNRMKKTLFDALDEMCEFDIPEGMVELEFNSIWRQFEEAKKRGAPMEEDASEEELKKEYRGIAERRVRLGILLSDTASRQKLTIGKEEIVTAITAQARMYPGQEQKIFDYYKNNTEALNELRGPILEEKAVDFIISQARVKDVAVTPEALLAEEDAEESSKAPKKKAAKSKRK